MHLNYLVPVVLVGINDPCEVVKTTISNSVRLISWSTLFAHGELSRPWAKEVVFWFMQWCLFSPMGKLLAHGPKKPSSDSCNGVSFRRWVVNTCDCILLLMPFAIQVLVKWLFRKNNGLGNNLDALLPTSKLLAIPYHFYCNAQCPYVISVLVNNRA